MLRTMSEMFCCLQLFVLNSFSFNILKRVHFMTTTKNILLRIIPGRPCLHIMQHCWNILLAYWLLFILLSAHLCFIYNKQVKRSVKRLKKTLQSTRQTKETTPKTIQINTEYWMKPSITLNKIMNSCSLVFKLCISSFLIIHSINFWLVLLTWNEELQKIRTCITHFMPKNYKFISNHFM